MLVLTLETRTKGTKSENCGCLDSSAEEDQINSKIFAQISQLTAQLREKPLPSIYNAARELLGRGFAKVATVEETACSETDL